MGNTNKRGGIGNKIKHFFKDAIGGKLKKAWDWVTGTVKGIVTTVHDDVKSVVSTLHEDAKGLVGRVSTLIVKTEDALTGMVKEVARNATALGSNISHDLSNMAMPLAIGTVATAGVMILSKK
jgi:phage-related protein